MRLFEWLHSHKEALQLINSFAPWFAALGTIAAACTALYLGLRRERFKLRVTALHKTIVGGNGPRTDCLEIMAVNAGSVRVNITQIDLQWGKCRRKQYAVFAQEFSPPMSSPLPVEIEPGQYARYYYPWDLWLSSFTAENEDRRLDPDTLQIRVWTSIGKSFNALIPKRHRQELIQTVER